MSKTPADNKRPYGRTKEDAIVWDLSRLKSSPSDARRPTESTTKQKGDNKQQHTGEQTELYVSSQEDASGADKVKEGSSQPLPLAIST